MNPTIWEPKKNGVLELTVLWIYNFFVYIKNSLGYINHSKSGPFENQTKTDHSKSIHVGISDPHCTNLPLDSLHFCILSAGVFKKSMLICPWMGLNSDLWERKLACNQLSHPCLFFIMNCVILASLDTNNKQFWY